MDNQIIERYEQRKKLRDTWVQLDASEKNRILQEIQQDHQRILMLEAKTQGEEKEKYYELRQKIEKQQEHLQQVDNMMFKKETRQLAPKPTVLKNTILAFLVGGAICTVGQIIIGLFTAGGLVAKEAGAATSAVLIFAGALFTGLGIYDDLGKFAGAGSIIPITGFANSIVSSAMEFKREGFVYGVGARLFTVAGPVIVYGAFVSLFIGLIYYFIMGV